MADSNGVRSLQGIAQRQARNLRRFFAEEVALSRKVTICAQRDRSGYLHVRCSGRLDPGTKQQIRNFISTLM